MQLDCRRCGCKKLGVSHAKLREVLHQDFANCSPLATVIGSPVGLAPTNAPGSRYPGVEARSEFPNTGLPPGYGSARCPSWIVGVGGGAPEALASVRRPKLHVRFSRMQLSRRLSDARMQEKELNRSAEQARTRRRAASLAAVSSPHYANAGTDATRCVAGSSRRDVGRACGCGRVCNTRPNPAEVD